MVQDNWRLCQKCEGLYFAGGPRSSCPAGGEHAHQAGTSYVLSDSAPSLPTQARIIDSEGVGLSIIYPAPPEGGGGNTGISVVSKGAFDVDGVNPCGISVETDGVGVGLQVKVQDGPGVASRSEGGRGVVGYSKTLDGVQGTSQGGTGIFGEGPQYGVHGKSGAGSAVYGEQTEGGDGVTGRSATGTGVAGVSSRGTGVYGRCDSDFGKAALFEGNVEVTGDICLKNADCAEDFDVADEIVEPGSVMVVQDDGSLRECESAYDKRVAGVASGAGRYRPALVLDHRNDDPGRRLPIALVGKVYCKVDATFGAIEAGDLLTTSPTRGHAMKAMNREAAFGTVIGKALQALPSGTGLIPVLVALQ